MFQNRRLMALVVPCSVVVGAALMLSHSALNTPSPAPLAPAALASAAVAAAAVAAAAPIPLPTSSPVPSVAPPASPGTPAEVVVGKNDTLDSIFRRMSLDKADLAAIRSLPGVRRSLDFLKPGDAIHFVRVAASVQELSLKVGEAQSLDVVRQNGVFTATMIGNPLDARTRTATATIDSSLFKAAESARISDTMALKLAGVFAWDIDFVLDIRAGDRFTAVYQQIYQDGKYVHDGELLAAEFVNNGKVYKAVRFVSAAGEAGYYAPDGKPMRKAFLRAPVEFTRVSSVFNPHRLHPILNLIRGHMGTDYAAPIGTPVHAAGDGLASPTPRAISDSKVGCRR